MAIACEQTAIERLIGYLGPQGTYSEEVALNIYRGEFGRFVPYNSICAAIQGVEGGEISECLVPIENSLEGSVNITMDTLAHEVDLAITREIVWSIRHSLLLKSGTKDVKTIISHPQALAQCRQYLSRQYPNAELKSVASTAEAVYLVASGVKGGAAIGSRRAGEIYSLTSVDDDIQDNPNNCTRFVALSRTPVNPGGQNCKTSLVCKIQGDRPGSLCDILQEFAARGVNLTRIESRPARAGLGMYIFFFDMEGSMEDDHVKTAVNAVKAKCQWFKNFGSYSVYNRLS
ncbi:MAG TPA: prephenate dehydratase [Methylomusa anaerophila]|uniref:Prephenate dehydratase n=1 Tax=Methylomusa anaerophila TaxID=1930071 RepID=A0A348AFT7_9FIRM|nr:prephenate dehydratase [Methylomusa anaerophila]BBB89935.1 prephenate dehydratase [Methylomusa anaerophila]HML88338.1 prephenate dehydratase [Methylomusa anaerophila]